MSEKKLNFAVIGCSWMAKQHMDGVLENKQNLYAICDVAQSQIDERLKEFTPEKTCNDYRELVNDPKVDVAIIVTPDYYHLEMTEAFLRAGKHVLCEKPMALLFKIFAAKWKTALFFQIILLYNHVNRMIPIRIIPHISQYFNKEKTYEIWLF